MLGLASKWVRLAPNGTIEPNVLKSDMKKFRICPIWGQSDPLWSQTYLPWSVHRFMSSYLRNVGQWREEAALSIRLSPILLCNLLTSLWRVLLREFPITAWQRSAVEVTCVMIVLSQLGTLNWWAATVETKTWDFRLVYYHIIVIADNSTSVGGSRPSGKLPFECQKKKWKKNLATLKKNWQKLSFFPKKLPLAIYLERNDNIWQFFFC